VSGYTEAEARFLYLVATHSGYFTARQFLAFTHAHWGARTTNFWSKIERLKHARTENFPESGVFHHLFSRRLYRRIDKENLRNRRAHEIDCIKRRVAILDFVIANQEYEYLESEAEKVSCFSRKLTMLILRDLAGIQAIVLLSQIFPTNRRSAGHPAARISAEKALASHTTIVYTTCV
jgi:hypothetical protein